MPIMSPPQAGPILAVVPAQPGATVTAGAFTAPVVAWALASDPSQAGGARVDPVFIAHGRTWTPDQYRAAAGVQTTIAVAAQ